MCVGLPPRSGLQIWSGKPGAGATPAPVARIEPASYLQLSATLLPTLGGGASPICSFPSLQLMEESQRLPRSPGLDAGQEEALTEQLPPFLVSQVAHCALITSCPQLGLVERRMLVHQPQRCAPLPSTTEGKFAPLLPHPRCYD